MYFRAFYKCTINIFIFRCIRIRVDDNIIIRLKSRENLVPRALRLFIKMRFDYAPTT